MDSNERSNCEIHGEPIDSSTSYGAEASCRACSRYAL